MHAHKYKNLFLRQSYLDSYMEYEKSLLQASYPLWDYVVLTASNESQARMYKEQIEYRLQADKLSSRTHYAVLPDPDGKRVGSGGATFNALKCIRELSNEPFKGKKILIIHSGGDSKRIPQYSACGKLFSPIPRQLPDGRRSTLFDEIIIGMTGVPARMEDGMLVLSGDVLLLFNPLQIDFYSKGAAALSIKEDVHTGKNHGVYLCDNNGNVGKFLHKQSVEILFSLGAVDARENVDIDTGAVIFSSNMIEDLYGLINTDEKFNLFVNENVRLSFYADFLYPLASESTLEQFYKETPEGDYSEGLKYCRRALWGVLHKYNMKLIRFSPASFIHFGTTYELLSLLTDEIETYRSLEWAGQINTNTKDKHFAVSNSYISRYVSIGEGSYIEDSYIHDGAVIGKKCVISGVTLHNISVPDNTVLHGLLLRNGKFVIRMYGVSDNPKESELFGRSIKEVTGIGHTGPLWTASIYPVCDTIEEAVDAAVNYGKSEEYISLMDSFNQADVTAILPWQSKLDDMVRVESLLEAIDNRIFVDDAVKIFNGGITSRAKKLLLDECIRLDDRNLEEFSRKIRIYYYLSKLYTGSEKEELLSLCFNTIRDVTLESTIKGFQYNPSYKIAKEKVVANLPVRVNWGGGWSDTPPYCMEHGGTVLNAAIVLDGKCPIEVVIKKIEENKIILASTDIGSYKEFTDIKELQYCSNPYDVFALHKAALIVCGVIPFSNCSNQNEEEVTFDELLSQIGGGFYLSTRAINIPRGSGLGTSSILAGACVKGIYEFLGEDIDFQDICKLVLCMEQIMSTGGGWQDQAGGLKKGIKMITSNAGLDQHINSEQIQINDVALKELEKRFCIIYTGQRRLARNLLREVVGKYIGCDPIALEVLYEIQRISVLMRFELEKENIDGFAQLLNRQWESSKKLDSGCTNTCIDQIFYACEDLIEGRMICGAGGGGFLQVILKKGITVEMLREWLSYVFGDSGVDVWDCEFWM